MEIGLCAMSNLNAPEKLCAFTGYKGKKNSLRVPSLFGLELRRSMTVFIDLDVDVTSFLLGLLGLV